MSAGIPSRKRFRDFGRELRREVFISIEKENPLAG